MRLNKVLPAVWTRSTQTAQHPPSTSDINDRGYRLYRTSVYTASTVF